MKEYQFTITLFGIGENGAQAWDDAVEGFCADSGPYDEGDITSIIEAMKDIEEINAEIEGGK